MPVTPTYPGVYIEEIPSGVRTITGVATSITAFVGLAMRGPVDKAVTINSYADFERIFGGLSLDSAMSFAVNDFYGNNGGKAVIVRLFEPTFENEADRQQALSDAQTEAQAAADAVKTAAEQAATTTGSTPQSVAQAAQDAIPADASAASKAAATAVAKAAADAAAATTPAPTPASVAAAAAGAVAQAVADASKAAAPVTKALLDVNGLKMHAAYEGKWGNYLRVRIDHDVSEDKANDFGLNKTDLFNLTVRDMDTGVTESFRNLTVVDSPRRVDQLLENESRLVRVLPPLPSSIPGPHPDPAEGNDIFDVDEENAATKVADADKAVDSAWLTEANFTGTGKEANKQGLFALEQADLFNLLCIPPYLSSGDVDSSLIEKAIIYCKKRRAMLLIDPPSNWIDKEKVKSEIASAIGPADPNAAVYFPRVIRPNPLRENQMEEFVPCGAVAGVIARTDAQRGVWKAPAGLEATLFGVPRLRVNLTDAENGELNSLGVNCLRNMPAVGRVIWGSRTRAGDDRLASEWKYLNVRRFALFLQESLYRGTQWVVFEPNDEPLWAQIRLNIGAFMHDLFGKGAFQGATPREAYFVKCDKETTTQNDINLGIVNIVVGFAPLKPAEFVILKFQQIAGQIAV